MSESKDLKLTAMYVTLKPEVFSDISFLLRTSFYDEIVKYARQRGEPDCHNKFEAFADCFKGYFNGSREACEAAADVLEATEFYQLVVGTLKQPISEKVEWGAEREKHMFSDTNDKNNYNVWITVKSKALELIGGERDEEDFEKYNWEQRSGSMNIPIEWNVSFY